MDSERKLFPTIKALIAPLIVPVATFVLIEIYFSVGGVIYAHGSMSMLIFFVALWGVGALVWECVAVPIFTYKLIKNPVWRSRVNILSLFAATAYIVVAIVFWLTLT